MRHILGRDNDIEKIFQFMVLENSFRRGGPVGGHRGAELGPQKLEKFYQVASRQHQGNELHVIHAPAELADLIQMGMVRKNMSQRFIDGMSMDIINCRVIHGRAVEMLQDMIIKSNIGSARVKQDAVAVKGHNF